MKRASAAVVLIAVGATVEACTSLLGITDVTSAGDTDGVDATAADSAPSADSASSSTGRPDAARESGESDSANGAGGCVIAGTSYTASAVNPTNTCQSCQPATSTSTWAPVADGSGCGNGQVCAGGACGTQCAIGGTVYASGAANPVDACQSCQPGASTTGWTDDTPGTACGAGEVCGGSGCAAGCFVGSKVYPSGSVSPSDACQVCSPARSTTSWTTAPDGASCGTGQVCSSASCVAGCSLGGSFYSPGAANPTDPCQTCQPSTSTIAWTDLPLGASCGAGQVCNASNCAAGCSISGTVYAANDANPTNACQTCQPTTSTTLWSNAADGTGCGNGQVCAGGQCGSQCDIGGSLYASGASNPANACQSCQPGTSTVAWSTVTNGTRCASGEVCNTASCVAGCAIGGTFYAIGTVNPASACQVCDPTSTTTAWTGLSNGTACGTGEVCSMSSCISACSIGGAVYASGAANQGNACQTCNPGASTSAWSNLAGGTTCGSGEVCSGASCVSSCYIGGAVVASGASNPANACQTCQPGSSTTTWTNVTSGTSCGSGNVCSAGTCFAGCYVGGTIYDSNASDPANSCQTCQPATSTSAWSNVTDGTGCGNGLACADGACGSQCVIGGTAYPSATTNPTNPCQSCQPGTSTTAWTSEANGLGCATGSVCNAASCVQGCYVAGAYYGANAPNPANSCQTCQPSTSTTSWTTQPRGTTCASGDVCNGSTCASECYIGGAFLAPSASNPANACETCQPAVSTSAWSNVTDGSSCGTQSFCASGACLPPKYLFVTSHVYAGDTLGGLSGADAACASLAAAAGLPGTYKAWLSSSTVSAASRLTHASVPYVLPNQTIVAEGWAGLTSGTIQHAINVTEQNGSAPSGTAAGPCNPPSVWTNSNADGSIYTGMGVDTSCVDWTGDGPAGMYGAWSASSYWWTDSCGGVGSWPFCTLTAPLYCVQQ